MTNRLTEVPEVASLGFENVDYLVRRGFGTELGYAYTEEDMVNIVADVQFCTLGLPQRVHELCLEFAYLGEEKRAVNAGMLAAASRAWLQGSLNSAYTAVESFMNERKTVAGRRNQVLFALGQVNKDEFSYTDIEEVVRREFPGSTADKSLNDSGLLGELARPEVLIRRSTKGDRYIFVDPLFRMCIRVMLYKTKDGGVDKLDIRKICPAPRPHRSCTPMTSARSRIASTEGVRT